MDLKSAPIVSQRTTLSPRLFQSLKVLQLDAAELMQMVQRELCENPLLELPEPDNQPNDNLLERELWHDYERVNRRLRNITDSQRTINAVEAAASPETLGQHLRLQLGLADLPLSQEKAGIAIIDSLNDAGYLVEPLSRIAADTGLETKTAEHVLAIIQRFDPPGIAARNLGECLMNQMEERDRNGLPGRLVAEYLPELARGSLCAIARKLGVSPTQIEHALALIRRLDPEPGAAFDCGAPAAAIIPDVFIHRSHNGWAVLANRQITPTLKISRQCELLAREVDDVGTYRYLRERHERARRLISDLRQRRITITRVAKAIAEAQEDFFVHGDSHMRPMKLENIASALDVSVSTISRAVKGKYMSTPQGIFEFKYFFAGGLFVGDGEGLASTAVKQRLKQIIAGEDNSRPMSDQKLTECLRRQNIDISRRTVAKYREELGVPPSCQRKIC